MEGNAAAAVTKRRIDTGMSHRWSITQELGILELTYPNQAL